MQQPKKLSHKECSCVCCDAYRRSRITIGCLAKPYHHNPNYNNGVTTWELGRSCRWLHNQLIIDDIVLVVRDLIPSEISYMSDSVVVLDKRHKQYCMMKKDLVLVSGDR